jgi:hypothetical protein
LSKLNANGSAPLAAISKGVEAFVQWEPDKCLALAG